jgi:predicted dehydrogenase
MRVGIVGVGSMGHAHAAGWRASGAEFVGVVSPDNTKAKKLADILGGQVYPSYEALLKDVDMVDICAPTHVHHDMVIQAAEAGKHIICEKPIALTVNDGIAMIRACERAGVRLFIGMVLHFFPQYIALKRAVDSGRVGHPQVIRMTRASYRPQRDANDWFMNEKLSGGMIVDLMIHDFEMSRWLAKGEAARVFARTIRSQHTDELNDHGLVIIRYDNGAMAHIEGSWAYPKPMFSVRAEIAGDNGLIEWDSEKTMPTQIHLHKLVDEASGDVALPRNALIEDPWTEQIKHFYACVLNDMPFRVTALDALRGLQISLAARESALTGKPVYIQPLEV